MELLSRINPDRGYAQWRRVGNALFHAGESFETWDAWSSGSAKYSRAYALGVWEAFRDEPRVPLTDLEEIATERVPGPRAVWSARIRAAASVDDLNKIVEELRLDRSVDDGDRELLARELATLWPYFGERKRLGGLMMQLKPPALTLKEEIDDRAADLMWRCQAYRGVSPRVVSLSCLQEAMAEVMGRRVPPEKARRLLECLGFKYYGQSVWDGKHHRFFTPQAMEKTKENSNLLRFILNSYQALTP